MKKTILCFFLFAAALLLISCGAEKQSSNEERGSNEIIRDLTASYGYYGDKADHRQKELLQELKETDPVSYQKWDAIMGFWKSLDTDLSVNEGILPDGLAQTDSLCLIALGFRLNPDGSMREELICRLEVVKASAEKYPNARILCTGGPTSPENPAMTEAGSMAAWLVQNGIDESRIIVEDRSLTTAQNAMYSYDLLSAGYPQVTQLAIISSDYHIATGALLFEAESILRADNPEEPNMAVVSNAAWHAPSGSLSSTFQAGALIELTGDRDTANDFYYGTYDISELPDIS